MGPDEFLAHTRADSIRLAAVAEGHLDRRVPSCPAWTVADLLGHTGEVHRFWAEVVRTQAETPPRFDVHVPEGEAILAWFRDGLEDSLRVLRDADPATPVWTWTSTDDTAAWIQRRMAQETAVHRWDGELAIDQTTDVDRELAIDGIDEFVDVFLPELDARPDFGQGTIHLHSTDGEGEWLLELSGGDVKVTRGHAKGDVAVRGSASDLLLVLWRRLSPSGLEVFGDAAVLDRFLAAVAIG